MKIIKTYQLIILLFCSTSLLSTTVVANEDKEDNIILLWPKDAGSKGSKGMGVPRPKSGDGHIRITNVKIPSMEYFPAPEGKKPKPMVILCPGGGYRHLVITKMSPIAKWLNEHGISACILKYRIPKEREDAFQDMQRAIRIMRSRASEFNIDPDRIGVLGASAGGHLAARASTSFNVESYQPVDEIDTVSCRPDFAVLLYPAYMNTGETLNPEFIISDKTSPTLIISAKNDKKHFPGSPVYAKALEDAGVPIRVRFFEKGGHGFAMEAKKGPLLTWPDFHLQWLKDMDILEDTPEKK